MFQEHRVTVGEDVKSRYTSKPRLPACPAHSEDRRHGRTAVSALAKCHLPSASPGGSKLRGINDLAQLYFIHSAQLSDCRTDPVPNKALLMRMRIGWTFLRMLGIAQLRDPENTGF